MTKQDDLKLVREQERVLVLPSFDELVAFKLGISIRDAAIAAGHAIAVDIRTWDRQVLFLALPGTSANNIEWVRRKSNVVKLLHKSSYQVVLQKDDDLFPEQSGISNVDYAIAGGSFPLRVETAGLVGAITVSGLDGRDDHRLAVNGLCDHLGVDPAPLTLPSL